MIKLFLSLSLCLLAGDLSAAVTLSLLNAANPASSNVSAAQGGTFSLIYRVEGLTTPLLNNFDTQLDAASLPTGVSLTSFTSTPLPTGWLELPNIGTLTFGGVNFTGSDITASSDLVTADFFVALATTPGTYTVSFMPPGVLMALRDSSDASIAYTASSATLTVLSVPEPSRAGLFLFAGMAALWHRRRCVGESARHR